jgi:hypothetical protein
MPLVLARFPILDDGQVESTGEFGDDGIVLASQTHKYNGACCIIHQFLHKDYGDPSGLKDIANVPQKCGDFAIALNFNQALAATIKLMQEGKSLKDRNALHHVGFSLMDGNAVVVTILCTKSAFHKDLGIKTNVYTRSKAKESYFALGY